MAFCFMDANILLINSEIERETFEQFIIEHRSSAVAGAQSSGGGGVGWYTWLF